MRKLVFALVLVAVLMVVIVPATFAAPPAFHYGMVRCSGLSLSELASAQQKFDSAYGWAKNLDTPEKWSASYIARVNQFAATVGCPAVLIDDGTPTGVLTLHYKLYDPWFEFYLSDILPTVFRTVIK